MIGRRQPAAALPTIPAAASAETQPIGTLAWRERGVVEGRVRSICVQPRVGAPTLEATVVDESGGVLVVFLGRRHVAGINPGATVRVTGVVGDHHRRLAFLNPEVELLAERFQAAHH